MKGFTLVELVAILVILGVIALITIPVVSNSITDSRRNVYKASASEVIKAANAYYMGAINDNELLDRLDGRTNVLNDLSLSGDIPDSGNVYIDEDGKIAIALIYLDFCYIKDFSEKDIRVIDNITSCELELN